MKKRVVFDRAGNPVVEVKNRDGIFEPVLDQDAMARLKANDLSVAATGIRRATGRFAIPGHNPYQGASIDNSKKLRKRSGLDYLRQLSEEIKKKKT